MKQMKKDWLTIIIATYNSEDHLERCLKSILNQNYIKKQIVIIDGMSSDNTVDIIKKYESSIDYWSSEADSGIAEAWNKGIDQAAGEWLCFLGSDDFFCKDDVLNENIIILKKCPSSIKIAYSNMYLMNSKLEIIKRVGESWEKAKKKFLSGAMTIPHPGMMHHYSLFNKIGNFDENFKITLDYEFLLRELVTNDPYYMDKDLITVCMVDGGTSNQVYNRLNALKEVRLALKKNNLSSCNISLLFFWIRSLFLIFLDSVFGSTTVYNVSKFYRKIKFKK